jgi:DNA polymerase III subunit delta
MFIILHGTDEFIAHEELARLKAEDDFRDGVDTFTGLENSLEEIRSACDTLPFFSARRLVIVEGLPRKKRGRKEAVSSAAFAEDLVQYVPQMPSSTLLVVVVDELLDASNPLVKAAKRYGEVKVCVAPRGTQLESWLMRRASAAGSDLSPEGARLLASSGSESLWALAGEIEKLSTYVGRGGKIGPEEIRALTPASHHSRVFDLTDALAKRDRGRALALLHELLESGESPFGIVALTASQTRSLIQIKVLSERGGKRRAAEIAQITGIAPYMIEKSLPLARQFSLPELEATHRRLLDIDTSLKRSKMTPEMALDLLVFEFGTKSSE